MWRRKPIAAFLCRFVLIYVVLAFPWPGINAVYGGCFRALARMVFDARNDRRELAFETTGANSTHPLDTRIVIANPALLHEDGSGPVRNLDIGISWQPVALLLALILATPIPWGRRFFAMLWGFIGIHCVLLSCLSFFIWTESAEIGVVTLSPFWKHIAGTLEQVLIAQFTPAIPAMIWILVTFRREDKAGLLGLFAFGSPKGSRAAGVPSAAG